jgi:hypothetical protein
MSQNKVKTTLLRVPHGVAIVVSLQQKNYIREIFSKIAPLSPLQNPLI